MLEVKGKNVLITGASSGIGAAMAREFASLGARLYLLGRNVERLEQVAELCRADRAAGEASSVSCYQVDMESSVSVERFVSEVEGVAFDIIVLNAGISQRALCLDTDCAVDRKLMETNFFGPVTLVKALAPVIRDRRVSIAVTTSISGLFGFPLRSAYCASKHALFGFFESLQLENPRLRVTFLIPGRIQTAISRSAVLADGSAYDRMDPGQANGMPVDKCARIAVRAIRRGRRRKLIGGIELLMVYIKKWCPALFFKLAGKVSSV